MLIISFVTKMSY